jgi:hypothetical protein
VKALRTGAFVLAPRRPELGAGAVVAIAGTQARVFFLEGGRRTIDLETEPLAAAAPAEHERVVLHAIARTHPADWVGKRCHHSVYVVLLSARARKAPRFVARNPGMQPSKSCLYVGLTGLSPEERFENHKADHKAARFAGDLGRRLAPEHYARFNPMPWPVGMVFEPYLADALRRQGHGVWQN